MDYMSVLFSEFGNPLKYILAIYCKVIRAFKKSSHIFLLIFNVISLLDFRVYIALPLIKTNGKYLNYFTTFVWEKRQWLNWLNQFSYLVFNRHSLASWKSEQFVSWKQTKDSNFISYIWQEILFEIKSFYK